MEYRVSELAQKTGVTKRTIHYYISKGLLMPPNGSGVNSSYDDSHVERILLIKKLQAEYMPLNKIRDYIFEEGGVDTRDYLKSETITTLKQDILSACSTSEIGVYIRENICNVFEMHYTQEQADKYKYIIENVKKYVEKMLED